MVDLIKDLSTLTTIPYTTLTSLVKKSNEIICYDIQEQLSDCKNITSINIGIGNLNIIVDDDEIKYKFIPSNCLQEDIKQTVITGESPLVKSVESALHDKIVNVYKELF